jgi:hypothetical protein
MADTINVQQLISENENLRNQAIEHFREDESRAEQDMDNSIRANREAIFSLRQFELQSINNANDRYLQASRTESANFNKLEAAKIRGKQLRRSVSQEQNSVRRLKTLRRNIPQIEAQKQAEQQKQIQQKAEEMASRRINNIVSFSPKNNAITLTEKRLTSAVN